MVLLLIDQSVFELLERYTDENKWLKKKIIYRCMIKLMSIKTENMFVAYQQDPLLLDRIAGEGRM